MKRKSTYSEMQEVTRAIESIDGKIDDMLSRKIVRFMKNIKPVVEDYNDEVNDINAETAMKKKSGAVERDESGKMMHTPEGLRLRAERLKQLLHREVEIDVVRCEDRTRIDTLETPLKILLNGFIFDFPEFELQPETE